MEASDVDTIMNIIVQMNINDADGWVADRSRPDHNCVACIGAEVTGLYMDGWSGGPIPQLGGLTGDVGLLRPLGSLATLVLSHTAVSGNVADLSSLT